MNTRTSKNGYTKQAETCMSASSLCAVMLIMDAIIMASVLLCVLHVVRLVVVIVLVLLVLNVLVIISRK